MDHEECYSGESGLSVVVGPFASEPFTIGLQQLFSENPHFHVSMVNRTDDLETALSLRSASVVILEGSDPTICGNFLERFDTLSVVLLDPVGAKGFIALENPDWKRLANIIQAAAGDRDLEAPSREDRVTVVDGPELTLGSTLADPESLAELVNWLDLTFALALHHFGLDHQGRGIPGWSVAPNEALAAFGGDATTSSVEALASARDVADDEFIHARSGLPSSIEHIADVFSLTDTELRLLCLTLATDIDGRFATATGVLQDDLTRRRPGLTLLALLLGEVDLAWDLRPFFGSEGSLTSSGLLEPAMADEAGLAVEEGYRVAKPVVARILCGDSNGAASAVGANFVSAIHDELSPAEEAMATELGTILAGSRQTPVLHLTGSDDPSWFERISAAAGLAVLRCDASSAHIGGVDQAAQVVKDWVTLAQLENSALLVVGVDALPAGEQRQFVASLALALGRTRLVAVLADCQITIPGRPPVLRMSAPQTNIVERIRYWTEESRRCDIALSNTDARLLGTTLQMARSEIESCLQLCAAQGPETKSSSLIAQLRRIARRSAQLPLPPAVRRIDAVYTWDDLVVADLVRTSLETITAHVGYSGQVLEDWNFSRRLPYGRGVAVLFSGPSGTGKTMAAQIIAGDLGVELLQVDLSKTISKYIGETEKNLDRVFEAAEQTGGALLFDEADALFGKRTEVKDAHDRHANVEVAYLLQRIETFSGLAILTTNLKKNIDQAFLRRLRFVVDFAVPSAVEREAIWHRSFPKAAPLDPDLDIAFLARRLALTGGSIQNIALHAAFAAAAAESPKIKLVHIVDATRRELIKNGMLNAQRSLDELVAA